MDAEEIAGLSPAEMRKFLLEEYRDELARTVTDVNDVKLFASFVLIERGTPRAIQQTAARAQNLFDEASSPDYEYWLKARFWTAREAVALLTGLDPDRVKRDGDLIKRAERAHQRAAQYVLTERLVIREFDRDSLSQQVEQSRCQLDPRDVVAWALAKNLVIPDQLASLREGSTSSVSGRWPWGAYETPLLTILAAAVEKWWVRYDPADPSTAPKKTVVMRWIEDQGVTARTADQMDTILRPKDLPKGPR